MESLWQCFLNNRKEDLSEIENLLDLGQILNAVLHCSAVFSQCSVSVDLLSSRWFDGPCERLETWWKIFFSIYPALRSLGTRSSWFCLIFETMAPIGICCFSFWVQSMDPTNSFIITARSSLSPPTVHRQTYMWWCSAQYSGCPSFSCCTISRAGCRQWWRLPVAIGGKGVLWCTNFWTWQPSKEPHLCPVLCGVCHVWPIFFLKKEVCEPPFLAFAKFPKILGEFSGFPPEI